MKFKEWTKKLYKRKLFQAATKSKDSDSESDDAGDIGEQKVPVMKTTEDELFADIGNILTAATAAPAKQEAAPVAPAAPSGGQPNQDHLHNNGNPAEKKKKLSK